MVGKFAVPGSVAAISPVLGRQQTDGWRIVEDPQKGEGLTNGKKRRIDNLLISKTIYVFAVSLARAKVWIVTVRVAPGLGRAVRVWPRPNANAFGHKRLGVAQREPVKGHRR